MKKQNLKKPINLLQLLLISVLLNNCSKVEFDSFNPTTSTFKWIITKDKNDLYIIFNKHCYLGTPINTLY